MDFITFQVQTENEISLEDEVKVEVNRAKDD